MSPSLAVDATAHIATNSAQLPSNKCVSSPPLWILERNKVEQEKNIQGKQKCKSFKQIF